ncbi:TMEM165/GDT1 family protein [Limnoraphis robusta Tam1]|uniref:TMEM165/GDT1 family protein n=1 Tax=Limnoraphis robusta TaxID=1118279 RepID=UPI002B219A66|nr:TMEM165/GDT1 family protein [Limnoraphis robusta]MEA5499644.1 TMEM165/GDT1 family protein [Limnoraphis robusta BA-68 BA1]MEA5541049.1 TMEM165/GDT1 family protein [Limnoraphis robusta Tam1]
MLTAFTAGLLLITLSELGDKTFFIAVILSGRYSRKLVFFGVTLALALMTVLSVFVGQIVSVLPKNYLHYAEIILFCAFGIKLLYDASKMSAKSSQEEEKEAVEAVEKSKSKFPKRKSSFGVVLEAFLLTFTAEWGDRTQIATIALAASYHPVGVVLGATLGHAICAAIAVIGGRLIAGKISERMITAIGGCLFILFGLVAIWEGVGTQTI